MSTDYPRLPYPALPALDDAERIARATTAYERLRTRRTCRFFSEATVPREVIEQACWPQGLRHRAPIISRGTSR